jgi:hypothetical protein
MTDHYFLLRHPIKKPPKKKKKTIDCLPSLSVGSLADHQRTTQRCQIDWCRTCLYQRPLYLFRQLV